MFQDRSEEPRTEPVPQGPPSSAGTSAIAAAVRWCRANWLRIVGISVVVLVPCFWHARLVAGDLGSHTYNAWLVLLIERGQAPGLWLGRQTTNILFDLILSGLGSIVGLWTAERLAVSASILLFFWGAFTLACALSRRVCWTVLPCLAMFAYGWTFQQGFLNYYISIALAFPGLALVAAGRKAERALGLLLLPLMWMAHSLGMFIFLGAGAYLWIASRLKARDQFYLLAVAACTFLLPVFYLSARYKVMPGGSLLERLPYNGGDQLFLYGLRYFRLEVIFLAFVLLCVLGDAVARRMAPGAAGGRGSLWQSCALPLQLYIMSVWSALLLPRAIQFPQYSALLSMLRDRVTSLCAVLLCCVLGALLTRRWHLAGFGAIAAVFFAFLYQDTGKLSRMEEQAERYERVLPPGQRILATIFPFVGSRVVYPHLVDRSCIGYCFSYGNYEPSSAAFRVRAEPGNRIVLADFDSADAAALGEYVVQPGDLPVFQIYQCSLNMTDLCMRELAAGEKNGSVGLHLNRP
jgi:hypothetical protein